MLAAAERDPAIGIVTGKLLRFDGKTLDSTGQFLRRDLTPLERGYGEPDADNMSNWLCILGLRRLWHFTGAAMLDDIQLDGKIF